MTQSKEHHSVSFFDELQKSFCLVFDESQTTLRLVPDKLGTSFV